MYDDEITYYTRENLDLLKDYLNGYSKYIYLRHRSNSQYYYNVASGTILGRVHLPLSSGLYSIWFPDHCPSITVFYAILFKRKIDDTDYWFPAIATVCSHFEHGLPDIKDMTNLLKLSEVIGVEAFGHDYDIDTEVDIADDTVEKLVMITTIYDSEFGMMWDNIEEALDKFSTPVKRQLRKIERINEVLRYG